MRMILTFRHALLPGSSELSSLSPFGGHPRLSGLINMSSRGQGRTMPTPVQRLNVQTRNDKSLLTSFLHYLIRPLRPYLAQSKATFEAGSPRLTPPEGHFKHHSVRERCVENIWIYDVTWLSSNSIKQGLDTTKVDDGSSDKVSNRIVYFAGGGWQMAPSSYHWAFMAALTESLPHVTLSLVSYPLAPKDPASVSLPQLMLLYKALMEQSAQGKENVVFAGDSSGGNIAISLVLWALMSEAEQKLENLSRYRHPSAILAISPSTDLRHLNEDIKMAAVNDPILTIPMIQATAAAWCKKTETSQSLRSNLGEDRNFRDLEWTTSDPRTSPVLGQLHLFADHEIKVNGIVGTWDVLAPEAIAFMQRCREVGAEGNWLIWQRQMHAFPLASRYGLRESTEAMDWIIALLEAEFNHPHIAVS